MPDTPKGYTYPAGTDPAADLDTHIQTLAQDVDEAPGIRPMTTATRDALPAGQKWTGRVIWNDTNSRLEQWNGAQWQAVVGTFTLADAAPPAIADAGSVGVSTDAAREDHTHAPHAQMQRKDRPTSRYFRSVNASGALGVTDDIILASGTITITLPTLAAANGLQFDIKNTGTGVITIDPDGAEQIENGDTGDLGATYALNEKGESVTIASDGTAWRIL